MIVKGENGNTFANGVGCFDDTDECGICAIKGDLEPIHWPAQHLHVHLPGLEDYEILTTEYIVPSGDEWQAGLDFYAPFLIDGDFTIDAMRRTST